MSRKFGLGLAAVLLTLGACAHKAQTLPKVGDEPFRIGKEDLLDVTVWRDPDLTRAVVVRPDGFISMPLVGEVKAEGRTPVELAADLKSGLQPYVQEPRVTVVVREVRSARIYVTGEVARPGGYPIAGPISVLQAVALAGGFSDFADREAMLVIRPGQRGGRFPVRYSQLLSADPHNREALLLPGDTVVVP